MTYRDQTRASLLLTLGILAGSVLAALPEAQRQSICDRGRDDLMPLRNSMASLKLPSGAELVERFQKTEATPSVESKGTPQDQETISRLERQILGLKQQLSEQEQLTADASPRLFQPRLIQARLLTEQQRQDWKQAEWIDKGTEHRLRENDWILSSEEPLLDIGTDYAIHSDDLVLSGRKIVGQVTGVGRWSSRFRIISDPEFRCAAQVVSLDPKAVLPQHIGSLHGLGDGRCILKYVENKIPVRVGDYVTLSDPNHIWDEPLVLGKITSAEVVPNQPHWKIEVIPAAELESSRELVVLSEQLAPERLAVHPDNQSSGRK